MTQYIHVVKDLDIQGEEITKILLRKEFWFLGFKRKKDKLLCEITHPKFWIGSKQEEAEVFQKIRSDLIEVYKEQYKR